MIRIIALGLCALLVAVAPPAVAQTALPVAEQQALVQRAAIAISSNERMNALVAPIVADAGIRDAATYEDLAVAIETALPRITAAREGVRAIAADLSALPPLGRTIAATEAQSIDKLVASVLMATQTSEAYLADLEALVPALRNGDDEEVARLGQRMLKTVVLSSNSMATMLRGRLIGLEQGTSGYSIVLATACFYEGLSAYQNALYGFESHPEMAAQLEQASQCMNDQVALGRRAVAVEADTPLTNPILNRMQIALTPINEDRLTLLEGGATLLLDARRSLIDNWGDERLANEYSPRIRQFQDDMLAIDQRIVDMNRTQGH